MLGTGLAAVMAQGYRVELFALALPIATLDVQMVLVTFLYWR